MIRVSNFSSMSHGKFLMFVFQVKMANKGCEKALQTKEWSLILVVAVWVVVGLPASINSSDFRSERTFRSEQAEQRGCQEPRAPGHV